MAMRGSARLVACLLGALAAAGCGGEDWQAEVHPATGTLTINGEPAAGALVQLVPTGGAADERNSRPWGVVQADGTFALSTYDGEPGAPAGDYAATITWPPDPSRPSTADRLKSRYSRVDQAPARFTIRPGANALPPIVLTGVPLDAKAGSPARPGASDLVGPMSPNDPPKVARKGRR